MFERLAHHAILHKCGSLWVSQLKGENCEKEPSGHPPLHASDLWPLKSLLTVAPLFKGVLLALVAQTAPVERPPVCRLKGVW